MDFLSDLLNRLLYLPRTSVVLLFILGILLLTMGVIWLMDSELRWKLTVE